MQSKKELKENLFFHLKRIWTRSHKIELSDEIKRAIWSIVSSAMQTSYSKGYSTGIKNGQSSELVKIAQKEMIKLREALSKQDGCTCKTKSKDKS